MEEKYINLVKEAETLFEKIIKDLSFTHEKATFESCPFIHEERKMVNVSLTNKT